MTAKLSQKGIKEAKRTNKKKAARQPFLFA